MPRALIFAVLFICVHPALSQVNNPAYADYLLVGRFGEICTMCEAIVFCAENGDESLQENITEDGSFTLYHLQTRTFWSQVSTIWEWFIANFDSESLAQGGHTRPVDVYRVEEGHWSGPWTVPAQLSLDPATISLDKHTIDRVESRWFQGRAASAIGTCKRLPLWETLDRIKAAQ